MGTNASGRMLRSQGVTTGVGSPACLVAGVVGPWEATMGKKDTLTSESYCEKKFGRGSTASRRCSAQARGLGHACLKVGRQPIGFRVSDSLSGVV